MLYYSKVQMSSKKFIPVFYCREIRELDYGRLRMGFRRTLFQGILPDKFLINQVSEKNHEILKRNLCRPVVISFEDP